MARLIISGDLKEQDIMLIAKFFREYWRHRPERIFLSIDEWENQKSEGQIMDIFKKIFTEKDKDWEAQPMNTETIEEFKKELGL